MTKMFANAAIAGGAGTVWSYIMFTRERREREALQRRLNDMQRQADEERRQANETIQRLTEQIVRLAEARGNGNQPSSG